MIAKSILSALLIVYSISASSKSPYETNYYSILKEYDIHPPALKYGYPLWYQYDSLPVTGIIYLKDDLTDLHKINDITYVAEPTKENAEIIRHFSGKISEYPKFYIIPDSTLEWKKVTEFMEALVPDYWQTNFLLCGGSGRYFNISSKDFSIKERSAACRTYPPSLRIMNNCGDKLFVEGEITVLDSLPSIVSEFYFCGYKNDEYCDGLGRSTLDTIACLRELKWLREIRSDNPEFDSSENYNIDYELERMNKLLGFCRKKQFVSIPYKNSLIRYTDQGCGGTIAKCFEVNDLINRGVFLARSKRAKQFAKYSYVEMLYLKRVKHLEYVHTEFPDLVQHGFERFPEPLPEFPFHY